MKKTAILLSFIAALGLEAVETMKVTRNGEEIMLQTSFPGGYTLNQGGSGTSGPNKQFNFKWVTLTKEGSGEIKVKNSTDDTAPWNLNGTYIGANHGDYSATALICNEPHALTKNDLGSEWTNSKGIRFYVLKIESPTIVWVLSENRARPNDGWTFIRPKANEPLTHADGRVLKDFKTQYRLMNPQSRILSRKYLADGKPMEEKCTVECGVFTVEEEYDIVATDAILRHAIANPGKQVAFNAPGLESFVTQKIVYSFYPDSSCIIEHTARFQQNVRLSYMGFTQASSMTKGAYGKHLYYIPKTRPFEFDKQEWDFANMVDFTRPINGSMLLTPNTFENPQSMPERFIQYLLDSKAGQPDIGFVCGYSLLEGCTVPEVHAQSAGTALFLYKTHKTYPHAIDGGKIRRIKAGDTFHCVAYRQYFDPNLGYYLNRQGNAWLMYVDFHSPESGKRIALPEKLKNLRMELVEKSPTVQYQQQEAGLIFDSTGSNGYCVLKFVE